MEAGTKNRSTAATKMNEHSSRSHSIFTIYIETSEENEKFDETQFRAGKLHLVDLAGSEKQKQTQADHERLEEAKKINLSLSALGNVIKALVDGVSKHVPYRDSKLTRLLQDSLGGNTKTLMIAALSPSSDAYEETLSTLRYADRAKNIKNAPKINEDPKDALLREYEEEIKKLKLMISQMANGTSPADAQSLQNAMKQMEKNFQGVMSNNHVEDSVDALVKRLEAQGKKFKIVYEDEESEEETDKPKGKSKGTKKKKAKEISEDEVSEEEIIDSHKPKKKSKNQLDQSNIDFSGPIQELEKLASEKQALHEHKQQIEDQLKERQKEIEIEKQQKAQLEQILNKMQQKLVIGGQALEEKEKEKAAEVRRMQLEIEQQRQKEKELFEEKQRQEEEMLMVEKQYKSLQDEVEGNRNVIKELRSRYKSALQEIEDLKRENQDANEDNLITIREQESEIEFYQKLVKNLLKPEELAQIKAKSSHNEDGGWKIPPFVLKKHEVNFPKLSRGKAKAMVEGEMNQRDIEFDISYNGENNINPANLKQSIPNTQKIKKNAASKKVLNIDAGGIMSPKANNELGISYDHTAPLYASHKNAKSTRAGGGKKNISVQPASSNIKNYMNYSFEEDENPVAMRSMKKPNPMLAPIHQKPTNMPVLTNLEPVIPSVDELRKRRGDLMPLKHAAKRNNSYDSQD